MRKFLIELLKARGILISIFSFILHKCPLEFLSSITVLIQDTPFWNQRAACWQVWPDSRLLLPTQKSHFFPGSWIIEVFSLHSDVLDLWTVYMSATNFSSFFFKKSNRPGNCVSVLGMRDQTYLVRLGPGTL